MKKIIVTTTINKPTEATIRYSNMKEWRLIVVGDLKTPHDLYKELNCVYLHPNEQQQKYLELSNCLGWNTITRRNIGFIEAYRLGADIIASVDDDNIPYDGWGNNLCIGKEVLIDYYDASSIGVFDPLSVTNYPDLWHRGFPTQILSIKNDVKYLGKKKVKADVQADLWDGHPDVDAVCRLIKKPVVKFTICEQYSSNAITPFNTQNTFISRRAITKYMDLPFVGRMSDIWGAYLLQKQTDCKVVFSPASVYQDRNLQDTVTNMEHELIGYRNTEKLLANEFSLPIETKKAYDVYCNQFRSKIL